MKVGWRRSWIVRKSTSYSENIIVQHQVTEIKLRPAKITHLTNNKTIDEIPSFQTKCPNHSRTRSIKSKAKLLRKMTNRFLLNNEILWPFKTKLLFLHNQEWMFRSQIHLNENRQMSIWQLFQNQERRFRSMLLNCLMISCQLELRETKKEERTFQKTFLNLLEMNFEQLWTNYLRSLLIRFKKNDRSINSNWTIQISYYLLLMLEHF